MSKTVRQKKMRLNTVHTIHGGNTVGNSNGRGMGFEGFGETWPVTWVW